MQETNTSLLTLIPILYKWRKQIAVISGVAFLGTLIITLFLPNYYQSYTRFMAANTQASSPGAVFGGGVSFPYGSQEDNERLITVAESGELVDYLIDSLHLSEHYGINPTSDLARYNTIRQFREQYRVIRNIHGGIELRYEDKEITFPANLLRVAVARISKLDHAAATANLQQIALALEKSVAENEVLIQQLTDSINHINRKYKYASMELRQQALSQASPGMSSDMQWELIRKSANISADSLATIQEALTTASFLNARRADIHANYISQSEMLHRTKATISANTQTLQVIEKAIVPLRKCRPQRSFLVLSATFAATFFAILGILLYEKFHADFRR